jgi:hypothetical protein
MIKNVYDEYNLNEFQMKLMIMTKFQYSSEIIKNINLENKNGIR